MTMVKNFTIDVDGNAIETLRGFFSDLLTKGAVDALLVPQELASGKSVVQTLVKNPDGLKNANPFAFVMPKNSAGLISKLTDQNPGEKIGVVIRACEARATTELIKLKQINNENLVVIGVDCLGTYSMPDYANLAAELENITMELLKNFHENKDAGTENYKIRAACSICEHPIPENVDISIGVVGVDINKGVLIQAVSEKGEEILTPLELKESEAPPSREKAIAAYIERNTAQREELTKTTLENINSIPDLLAAFDTCIKCYNCREACPICYCKECIFDTPTMNPAPPQYMTKVNKRGVIRMPMDTILYQITRMNHMITSCVGCGMCESACPNDIPVAIIFSILGDKIQKLFDYVPGRDLEEELPLATFKEEELTEV
jgi:formate dehydrogenase subunit beta